ncbi:MAG: uracil-DNA glycosylase [Oscillospiraceae bacterium]|nr:uracil-DNA glycosylase [Oscillospiraceae bacterium]
MNIDSGKETINCQLCVNYYVTWDPSFPRGCRLYGFKTSAWPQTMVHEATGGKCQNFRRKIMRKHNA